MSKKTARTAPDACEQQYLLAWEEHWLYRNIFSGWYDAPYLRETCHSRKPPAFESSMRDILAKARIEWTAKTGLPWLDDVSNWWAAATAAGMDGHPVANVRKLSIRQLVDIITPWALAKVRTGTAVVGLVDGPVPPDAFCWNGTLHNGCPVTAWRLLKTLWGNRNRSSLINDLANPVWRDYAIDPDENQIDDVRKKANGFLKKFDIPFRVSKKDDYLSLNQKTEP